MTLKVIDGGFQEGHWQSDRHAYSEADVAAWNAIFAELARSHHPAWQEWVWDIKETSPLKRIK
ncbi:MAG TPA: hypothetical protein DCY27_13220 [Desulfobacterales bacterium]|nr:hypothetical protein [Desulfobacterales bacterium]